MAIQVFVPKFRVDECLTQIRECLEKGWTGLGFKTVEFEKEWIQYTHLNTAHFLNSNTSGLHLALRVLKNRLQWQEKDEIISTPLTFVSTNHAILYENLTPVFADTDEFLCLDPQSVVEKITPRTRAVMFVGLGGNVGRYEQIVEICRERGLALILDAAHMAGTRYRGKPIGAEADAVVFSFQAVKNLPTADSGMICFKLAEDDKTARKLSWLGINKDTFARSAKGTYRWDYDVEEVGFKYHGNSIMAGIGLVQLKYLDQDNAYRRQLAAWYREELEGKPGLQFIPVAEDCESSQHLLQIRLKNRDEMVRVLSDHQIYPGVHYKDNSEYSMYKQFQGKCPNAHLASLEVISLPLHLQLTRGDVHQVASIVREHL